MLDDITPINIFAKTLEKAAAPDNPSPRLTLRHSERPLERLIVVGQQICKSCGATFEFIDGIFVRTTLSILRAERTIRTSTPDTLPTRVAPPLSPTTTPICIHCAGDAKGDASGDAPYQLPLFI